MQFVCKVYVNLSFLGLQLVFRVELVVVLGERVALDLDVVGIQILADINIEIVEARCCNFFSH